jgi:hypothetical protein
MNETQSNSAAQHPAGGFDPEKAARLRSQTLDKFQAKGRTVERYLCAWLLICLAFAAIVLWMFFKSSNVQSWILFGVLFLVMFESTVLLKLWYWVVNSKLATLREIKLLRMDLAVQKGSMDALEELARTEPPGVLAWVLSRLERVIWRTAIIFLASLIAVIIATSGNLCYLFTASRADEVRTSITLNADGAGDERTEWEMQNRSLATLTEFPLYNGGSVTETKMIPATESPYTDGFGRKLAVRREPAGPNHRDVIQFVEPVPPFARFTLKFSVLSPWQTHATREGDVWTLKETLGPSSLRRHYSYTIALPPAVEIVAADPEPGSQEVRDGNRILHFEAESGAGQKWSYAVKYRFLVSSVPPR